MMLQSTILFVLLISAAHAFMFDHEYEFSYDPDDPLGPENWIYVNVTGNTCNGSMQSGIDIPSTTKGVPGVYEYMPGTCTVGNLTFKVTDHSIQANFPTNGACQPPTMKTPGDSNTWTALQFHFHVSSDHSIDGVKFGSEFHLVHNASDGSGRYAVLGVFVDSGAEANSGFFDDILAGFELVEAATMDHCNVSNRTIPDAKDPPHENMFNPYAILPAGYSIYSYNGSLTAPPCSEIVNWHVVDTPLRVSVREYNRIANLILNYIFKDTCQYPSTVASPSGSTGRPVMPLNGRKITLHCPPSTEGGCPVCDACLTKQGVLGRSIKKGSKKKCKQKCVPLSQVATMLVTPWKCGTC